MLIVMAGLPGTGKSTVARCLAEELHAAILDKDRIRAALFAPPDIEYSTRQDDFCMRIMLQVAEYVLRRDARRHVIVDGRTFSRRYQLDLWKAFSARMDVPLKVIECVCSDETVKKRLERDLSEGRHPAANRTYDMYRSVKVRFEPIEAPKLVIDTDRPLDACVRRCLAYVRDEKER